MGHVTQLTLPFADQLLPPSPPCARPESWLELIDISACETTGGDTPARKAARQAAWAEARQRYLDWRDGWRND